MSSARRFLAAVILLGACAPQPFLKDQELIAGATRRLGAVGLGDIQFALTQKTLPSGLRVAFERTPARGMVTVVLTVGAGSAMDPAGKEGLAHLLEHLAFRSRAPGDDLAEIRMRRLGAAAINGTVGPERTLYLASAPATQLTGLLATLTALADDPLAGITPVDLETERAIVRNEAWQRDETGVPGQLVGWIHGALFPAGHPYVKPPGGTLASIDAITLADLRAFARAGYRPSNATLTVVGEVNATSVDALARFYLPAHWRNGPAGGIPVALPALPGELPALVAPGYQEYAVPSGQETVIVTWRLPPLYGELGHFTRAVTTAAVFRRLVDRIRQVKGVRDVRIWNLHYQSASLLVCLIDLERGDRWKAIAMTVLRGFAGWLLRPEVSVDRERRLTPGQQREVAALARVAVNPLIDVQQKATLEALSEAEPFTTRAQQWAEFMQAGQPSVQYAVMLSRLIAADHAALTRFAQRHLRPEDSRVIHLEPQAGPPPALPVAADRDQQLATVVAAPGSADRVGPPPLAAAPPELAQARSMTLANGLTVVVIPRPGWALVTAAMAFRGGGTGAPSADVNWVLRSIEDRADVSQSLDWIDSRTVDTAELSINVVRAGAERLSAALYVLGLRLQASAEKIPWETILAPRAAPPPATTTPIDALTRRLLDHLYPGSPYARIVDAAGIARVTPAAVRDWARASNRPDNAILLVVGDVQVAPTFALARRWFETWTVPAGSPPLRPGPAAMPPAGGPRTVVIADPQRPQVGLSVACRLPDGGEADDAPYRLLGNLVVSWLKTRLRHDAGLAYDVGGGAQVLLGGTAHLILTATVDRRHLDQAARIVFGTWDAFGRQPLDPGATSQLQWFMATTANLELQTTLEEALSVLPALNRGWSLDHAAQLPRQVMNVTSAQLTRAFDTCRATTLFAFLGDEPTIRAAIEKHGPR